MKAGTAAGFPALTELDGAGWTRLTRWLADARRRTPVLELEGMHHVFRAEDVRTVLADSALFSSDRTRMMPPTAQLGRGNLTMMDPPDHTRIRRIVNQAFTPASVSGLVPAIDEIADELVGSLVPDRFDLVHDLAYPLPIRVISRYLGLPEEQIDRFRTWSIGFSRGDAGQMDAMHRYLAEVARLKRARPGRDLMSRLATAEVDGVPATIDEIASLTGLILLAGHVTTTSLIAAAVHHLCVQPVSDARVRENDQVDDLVLEALRVRPAFAQVTRIAAEDVMLSGTTVPAGALVSAWILSANHDPELNPDPEPFLLDRSARRHLSFGHGVHYCLGGPLAQLEATAAVRAVIRRFAQLTILAPVEFHPLPTLAIRRLELQGRTCAT
ncbi:cytochrome P450 [Streptomyces sp. bgisy060]|uniref:cytochrome P450 n=2 Tax=unclassified Streptomyces TaxID=2593676 RepID=UPI003EBC085E